MSLRRQQKRLPTSEPETSYAIERTPGETIPIPEDMTAHASVANLEDQIVAPIETCNSSETSPTDEYAEVIKRA